MVSWMRAHLVEEGLVGKPVIPRDPIPVFRPFLDTLSALHEGQRDAEVLRNRETKKLLWLDMLGTSSMAPAAAARERLFVTHSFLVAVARGAIATLTDPDSATLNGTRALRNGFVAWIVETHAGREWAERLFAKVHQFEWRQTEGDVLRPLYEALVEERDRKIFGEYYTPDWLADMMVREVLDDRWCEQSIEAALAALRTGEEIKDVGVLDPTCGSGTFLFHAARRILEHQAARDLPPARRSAVAALLVNGIDVHPIAAELARATLLRALPAPPPDGEASLRIYQGDALLTRPGGEYTLLESMQEWILIVTPGAHEAMLPRSLAASPSFASDIRRMMKLAQRPGPAPPPRDILESVPAADRDAVRACYEAFREIVRKEGNSIWAWYIINISGPVLLSDRKVNRVVANPPWVKMSEIQVEDRKRVLERLANETLRIWTGGTQSPHFDIASLFVKRVREQYLAKPEGDAGAWLVKKAALRAGNWEKFRTWHEAHVDQKLDLQDLQPFGGGDARRSCVLLENCRCTEITSEEGRNLVVSAVGQRPLAQQALDEIRDSLQFSKEAPRAVQGPSGYLDKSGAALFRQGATITPKVLAVIERVAYAPGSNEVRVRTSPSQHKPWKTVNAQEGVVPKHWVADLAVSKNLLPYMLGSRPIQAIVPTDRGGRLLEDPGSECAFWRQLEEIYAEFRGLGHGTPRTLVRRLDYSSTLGSQLPLTSSTEKRTVLYPTSGDVMRASRFHGAAVIDSTLYRWRAPSAEEAAYLVAVLNAASLRRAFKQSRTSGRHFHLRPWQNVPLPRFNEKDRVHRELAASCDRAERIAEAYLGTLGTKRPGQVGLSNLIRKRLVEDGVSGEIDQMAAAIMPDGVVQAG